MEFPVQEMPDTELLEGKKLPEEPGGGSVRRPLGFHSLNIEASPMCIFLL